jgi:GcrA cell cycle regulator
MKTLIDAGLSCAQIAYEIGVSRNAVIGKANRLHLSRLATQRQAERTGPPQIARLRITRRRGFPALQANPQAFVEMSANTASRRSLSELQEWHCRWPIGDPGTEDFGFCGNKPLDGLPYCSTHARMAYRRPPRALSEARRSHR